MSEGNLLPAHCRAPLPKLPANLAATGLLLDPEHVGDVREVIRRTKNEQAISLLAAWRRSLDRLPFAVLAGDLHRAKGGIVGGLAPDWPAAMMLFRSSTLRLDELAATRGSDFSSAWLLLVNEERQHEIQALAARSQTTTGSA